MSTNREWIKEVLAHHDGAPVPYNFSFSPPARCRVAEHYGISGNLEEALDFPIRMSGCKTIKPLFADPAQFGATAIDEFGVVWATNALDRGTPVGHPLTEATLAHYTFPDPAAAYRFEGLGEWCRQNQDHYTILWIGDLWERAVFMRGMESLLLDWVLNPGFVEALLGRLRDYILATMGILFAQFEFDAVALSDDYGTQRALLVSPAEWRARIKPLLKEIYTLARRRGRVVFHHSCGNITPIIPDLIEIGLDILHPVQPEAMDINKLKREFGRDLTLCGGIRTQDLLPCGTPAQVRAEVQRLKRELGKGGGFVLEPGITLLADVPLENLVAVIEEARKG